MARTWLSIRVDLVSGRGEDYWPRPGRIFAAARSHKFSQLADAIDTAFARWDRSHLYKFEMADGPLIGQVEFDDFDLGFIDGAATRLSTLSLGEQFVYEFDFGDSWTHLCTVRPAADRPGVGVRDRSEGPAAVLGVGHSPTTRLRAPPRLQWRQVGQARIRRPGTFPGPRPKLRPVSRA